MAGAALGAKEKPRPEVTGLGHLVVTTQAGYIMILDLSTLEVLAKVEPPKKEGSAEETDPFVSVTYCSGTDRLCACTKGEKQRSRGLDTEWEGLLTGGGGVNSLQRFMGSVAPYCLGRNRDCLWCSWNMFQFGCYLIM